MNLLLWFAYDESGDISRMVRIEIMPPDFNLDKHFVDYMKPPFTGGGVGRVTREHVVIPEHIIGIESTAYVLYYQNKRFAAAMPYFQTITKV